MTDVTTVTAFLPPVIHNDDVIPNRREAAVRNLLFAGPCVTGRAKAPPKFQDIST